MSWNVANCVCHVNFLRRLQLTLEKVTGAIDSTDNWTDGGRGMPCAEAYR